MQLWLLLWASAGSALLLLALSAIDFEFDGRGFGDADGQWAAAFGVVVCGVVFSGVCAKQVPARLELRVFGRTFGLNKLLRRRRRREPRDAKPEPTQQRPKAPSKWRFGVADALELLRGKSARVFGHVSGLLALIKGLPLAYNKDLQEDKEAVFDVVDTLGTSLEVAAIVIANVKPRIDVMNAAAKQGYMNATELADYLVRKGLPFREAHEKAGQLVLKALAKGVELEALSLDEMMAAPREPSDERTSDNDPELAAALATVMQERERRWVDEPVPALRGLTPRQAADDPVAREELERLLRTLDDRRGSGGFDTDRIRDLLGLPNERRH